MPDSRENWEVARDLWQELPASSLTIADRNFLVADDLCAINNSGPNRHWLTRAKKKTKLRRIEKLGRNDESRRGRAFVANEA